VIGRRAHLAANLGEQRDVSRQYRAVARRVSLDQIVPVFLGDDLIAHALLTEELGDALRPHRARQRADRRAGKLQDARHRVTAPREEALPVVEQHAREARAELSIAAQGPRGAARQHVYVARLQSLEAVIGAEGPQLHRILGAEHGRCKRGAKLDVQPRPLAASGNIREAGLRLADPAQHVAARADGIERRAAGGVRRADHGQERTKP
jgi:hypothetical protein